MKFCDHYLQVSSQASTQFTTGLAEITHLIWPKSAFPFFLARDPAALSTIANSLGPTTLITGAARMETVQAGDLPGEIRKIEYFNAIQVIGSPDGSVLDFYDKVHLVPFGEVPALLRPARILRHSAVRPYSRGIRTGNRAQVDRGARAAKNISHDLLRGDFSRRHRSRPAKPSRNDRECEQ